MGSSKDGVDCISSFYLIGVQGEAMLDFDNTMYEWLAKLGMMSCFCLRPYLLSLYLDMC